MDRFRIVANEVGVRTAGLVDWLFRCAHSNTTFPMTLRAGPGACPAAGTSKETYIACLDCGRHLPYDWTAMRIAKRRLRRVAPPVLLPALRETGRSLR